MKGHGSVAQLNRASDYGSEGYSFESCRNHKKEFIITDELFFYPSSSHKKISPPNHG